MQTITLKKLLEGLVNSSLIPNLTISGIALDSRKVQSGFLFCAYPGTHVDGREYIQQAIENGAAAILADESNFSFITTSVPLIKIPYLQNKLSHLASRFYKNPSKKLQVVGVTGTNGKTSVSHFLAQVLNSEKIPCGLIGTLGYGMLPDLQSLSTTTPDPVSVQKILSDFKAENALAAAIEVSSHALTQGRVNNVEFAIAIFTNLTRDHLDYHVSMEEYGNAKLKLFMQNNLKYAVVNLDDPFSQKIIEALPKSVTAFTYSLEKQSADIYTSDIKLTSAGIQATLHTPWESSQFSTTLLGRFNLSNLLAVLATTTISGVCLADNIKAFKHLMPIPGRMEMFSNDNSPLVVVDYAHTPDALKNALQTLRLHTKGEIHCVFGCGGDRDPGKRALMGEVADKHADHIILTNDNPRNEDPKSIITAILSGIKSNKATVEYDRKQAIQHAFAQAKSEDVILLAGKGHEDYQLIGDETHHFDEREIVSSMFE